MNLYKYFTRGLVASDSYVSTKGSESMANFLTYQGQNVNRLKYMVDKTYRKDINELIEKHLFVNKEFVADAKAQVEKEAEQFRYHDSEKEMRLYELINEARPPELVGESKKFATDLTGNTEVYGNLGFLVKGLANGLNSLGTEVHTKKGTKIVKLPLVGKIAAFASITSNVMTGASTWIPVYGGLPALRGTYGSLVFGHSAKKYQRELSKTERTTLLKRQAAAFLGMAVLYGLSDPDDGIIEITGNGTGDYAKNKDLHETTGWRENSIRIGDTYIPYGGTVLHGLLYPIGDARDAVKYRGYKDSPIKKTLTNMAWMPLQLSNMTVLANTDNITNMLSALAKGDTEGAGKKLLKTAEGTYSSYVSPVILKDMKKAYDWMAENEKKDALDFPDRLASRSPVAALFHDDRMEYVDVLGETHREESFLSRVFSASANNELMDWYVKETHSALTPPKKSTTIFEMYQKNGELVSRPVTDGFKEDEQIWFEYCKIRGALIKDALINASFKDLKGEELKEEIETASRNATTRAKAKILTYTNENPIDNLNE